VIIEGVSSFSFFNYQKTENQTNKSVCSALGFGFNILTRKFDLRLQLRFFTQTELKNRSNELIMTTIDEHQYIRMAGLPYVIALIFFLSFFVR